MPARTVLSAEELDRFHRGDPVYFAQISGLYRASLRATTRRYGLSAADADDVIQEAWVQAYRVRYAFSNNGSLAGWVTRICRNICVDLARVHQRHGHVFVDIDGLTGIVSNAVDDCRAVHDGLRTQELGDWIDDQIMSLPPRQRQVATLRWLLRWPVARIAVFLERAPGTVKAELFSAREHVRRALPNILVDAHDNAAVKRTDL
ncbi:MAG TPA: RNA polymerase sigma factor [Gemmatimonadaceae bacterium]